MFTKEELSRLPVAKIREIVLEDPDEQRALIAILREDSRAGVRAHAEKLEKKLKRDQAEIERLRGMQKIENELREQGYHYICGIDEVGRGPLAGPVVTASVILPEDSMIPGINDSKKLSHKKRAALAEKIKEEALAYAYGLMSPEHIDEINILNATKHAMVSSVARLDTVPDILLIDAVELYTDLPVKAVIHGDAQCYAIAAASILAKEWRDDYMRRQAELYPEYHFDQNMGYGTAEHIEAIRKYGLCPIHRRSFCHKFVS